MGGYAVDYHELGREVWSPVTTLTAKTTIKVTKLRKRQTYQFRIVAENVIGCGKPLISDKVTTNYLFDPPTRPGKPTIDRVNQSSACVSWEAPASPAVVNGYYIEKKTNNTIS